MVGNTQTRSGPWKWSKHAYPTGTHFTYWIPGSTTYSLDSALNAEAADCRHYGRDATDAVGREHEHMGYSCNLGAKVGQANTSVETYVWWRAGWILHVHHVEPRQPVVLRVGGFALPLSAPDVQFEPSAAWSADGRGTVL